MIFSYEESYGYMLGDYVRDKDAVTASLLLTEMAAWYHGAGHDPVRRSPGALRQVRLVRGAHPEPGHAWAGRPEADGRSDGPAWRQSPPDAIAGVRVTQQKDYLDGTVVDTATGAAGKMELSGSNVLRYRALRRHSLIVRPSGTEPKVKVYILAQGTDRADCAAKVAQYAAWAESLKR